MDFTLVIILCLTIAAVAILVGILPSIASKLQVATGTILGAVGGTILMKLWKDRKGGEIEKQKAEVKEAEEDFQQVVNEVLQDIGEKEEKDYNSILDERL